MIPRFFFSLDVHTSNFSAWELCSKKKVQYEYSILKWWSETCSFFLSLVKDIMNARFFAARLDILKCCECSDGEKGRVYSFHLSTAIGLGDKRRCCGTSMSVIQVTVWSKSAVQKLALPAWVSPWGPAQGFHRLCWYRIHFCHHLHNLFCPWGAR